MPAATSFRRGDNKLSHECHNDEVNLSTDGSPLINSILQRSINESSHPRVTATNIPDRFLFKLKQLNGIGKAQRTALMGYYDNAGKATHALEEATSSLSALPQTEDCTGLAPEGAVGTRT